MPISSLPLHIEDVYEVDLRNALLRKVSKFLLKPQSGPNMLDVRLVRPTYAALQPPRRSLRRHCCLSCFAHTARPEVKVPQEYQLQHDSVQVLGLRAAVTRR